MRPSFGVPCYTTRQGQAHGIVITAMSSWQNGSAIMARVGYRMDGGYFAWLAVGLSWLGIGTMSM